MAWRASLSRSLKQVRFLFCQPSPGSAAAREVAKNCGDVNALNPALPFLARECSDVQPQFFARYGNYGHGFNRKLGSKVGVILIGQAAILIGLSNGSAFAQEDTVSLPATSSVQAEGDTSGLQRIEDGSVISNEHTIKWRIFTDKGRDFFHKRQLDEAEKFFQAALDEAKEGFGLRDPHVASALNNLAEFYRLKKEYEKAELLYMEAIEILEESFGSDDIRVGTALHSLGICYHLQHKFAQAQEFYERAMKIEGRVMGVGHPEYASTMYLLAKVLSLQGKRKDAESLTEESIRILEEAGLGESPTCIQRMRYLSVELLKSKRFPEAENWQRKMLHILELSKGWDSLDTANAAEFLSLTLQAMGNFKESEELLGRCLAVKKKTLSEDHYQVAASLVHLARLTLDKFSGDLKNVNNDVATYDLVRAKQLIDDSIRITEGMLHSSSKSTTNRDKIGATVVLLQALYVAGLLEVGTKLMQVPGLILLLRLPLEHMKHGSFKIDAVSISDAYRLFIWPATNVIDVRYTTLRIHFKNNFRKDQVYTPTEQALNKCISLYKEPHTRSLVSKVIKQDYLICLRHLTSIAESNIVGSQTMKLPELLEEAKQIMEELGEKSNR